MFRRRTPYVWITSEQQKWLTVLAPQRQKGFEDHLFPLGFPRFRMEIESKQRSSTTYAVSFARYTVDKPKPDQESLPELDEKFLKSMVIVVRGRHFTEVDSEREPIRAVASLGRRGTGYRVFSKENDSNTRVFDVGYSDLKTFRVPNGRKAYVDGTHTTVQVVGKGKKAKEKVMNTARKIQKIRPVNKYSGAGILLRNRLGGSEPRVLKSTKGKAKS